MKYYCGIDQGKRKSSFCVLNENREIVARKSLDNDLSAILDFLKPFHGQVKIVVESSPTWYWLVDGLRRNGFPDIVLAHAAKIAMITRAKVKTDARDARTLAELLLSDYIPESYIYPEDKRWLRDAVRLRKDLIAQRTAEFLRLKTMACRYGLKDPSRGDISNLDLEDVAYLLKDKYLALYVPGVVERIQMLNRHIVELEERLESEMRNDRILKRLREIPGIGKVLSLTILLECGDLSRFESVKGFCSYSRVAPGIAQSGNKTGRGRGSKQGNSYLKHAFMQAAVAAVRCSPQVRACFERHCERRAGRSQNRICYNIIAHKIAVSTFMVIKGRRFDMSAFLGPLDSKVEHEAS